MFNAARDSCLICCQTGSVNCNECIAPPCDCISKSRTGGDTETMQVIIFSQHPQLTRMCPPGTGEESGTVSAGRVPRVWWPYLHQHGAGIAHESDRKVASGIPRL